MFHENRQLSDFPARISGEHLPYHHYSVNISVIEEYYIIVSNKWFSQ